MCNLYTLKIDCYMKKHAFALLICSAFFQLPENLIAQNIFSGERVMVVGAFNGYVTTPYGTDYRTTTYRRLSIASGNPTDGRGQWATTINVQNTGGDVTPINMPGGSGNGFLFISGPSANRFQNKWVFSGVGQGLVDGINNISCFNCGNDMGLNMSTPGYYSFVFNDCGYTQTNSFYYVGYTTAAPVTLSRNLQVINGDGSVTVGITTSATPSTEEKIYVRYTTGTDFSGAGSSSLVQATGSGTAYTATIPPFGSGTVVRYYLFTSTRSLAQLTAETEAQRSLTVLNYADNGGANFVYTTTTLPVLISSFDAAMQNGRVKLSWTTEQEMNMDSYEIQKSLNGTDFFLLGKTKSLNIAARNLYTFTDINPSPGNNYYRLVSVEFSGKQDVSKTIRLVNNKTNPQLVIYPNPAKDMINVAVSSIPNGQYDILISNEAGSRIMNQSFNRSSAGGVLTLQLPAGTKPGKYSVRISNDNNSYNGVFLVL